MSSALPVSPAIPPVLFADAPLLELPTNFWALLLAPPSEEEPAAEITPTEISAGSPQQIAQVVLNSMLAPVAPRLETRPEVQEISQDEPQHKDLETPQAPFVLEAPQIMPMTQVEQVSHTEHAISNGVPSHVPDLPVAAAASKPASDPPVAFELRLTPSTEAFASPRVQRQEAANLERESHEAPQVPAPLPLIGKATPIIAQVSSGPLFPEPKASDSPQPLTASVPVEPLAKPEPPSTPVHEIAMRVSTPDAQQVDLRISERRGEVHVAVRTANTGLQIALQGDLGSLVGKLEEAGFRTEARVPESPVHPVSTHSTTDLSGSGTYGEHSDTADESNGRWMGSGSGYSHERQKQHQQRRPMHAWEEMMEDMQ